MLKYCIGVDVSKNDFHTSVCTIDRMQKVTVKSSRKFANSTTGFAAFKEWISKQHKDKEVPLVIVMEATGVYYEMLALYLFKNKYQVSVILPNKAKKYLQSTGLKSKNDTIDAQGLARMGAEQCLSLWQPMEEYFYDLRQITRQHQSLQELKTSLNNQLHACSLGMYPNKLVIRQLKGLITTVDKGIRDLEEAIATHIESREEVAQRVNNICGIKGLGTLSVAVILAETNGFVLFENSRQLVSYAGYDVVENQSGSHRGKTRISKKGNSRIRRALHMPAFSVVRYAQTPFTALFERTLERHGRKMKSYVAVQKKLLTLIYALWKSGDGYESDYEHRHTGEKEQEPSSLPGPKAGRDARETYANENSASQRVALHKVDIPSNESQSASSLQLQN
jgi:transposase